MAPAQATDAASFDEFIEATIETGGLAGVGLWARQKDGHVVYSRALGVESLQDDDASKRPPMSMDTVVRLASSSKLVTTIAVLQGVERGLFGLDEDVASYVPELAGLDVLTGFTWYGKPLTRPRDPSATITIRRLLSQTVGAGYDFLKWQPLWRVRVWRKEAIATGSTLEERLAYPLLHDPGDGWTYGSALSWAGRVLERASGMSLEQWLVRNISAPLGLTTLTFFPHRNPDIEARLAGMSHRSAWTGRLSSGPDPSAEAQPGDDTNDDDTNDEGTNTKREDACMGGEGIHCSINDFGKILYSLLADDGRLLARATTAEMFTKQLTREQRVPLDACLNLPVWICRSIIVSGQYDWGLGGVLIDGASKTGLQDGALTWSGLYHILWWIDRKAGVCGIFASQLTPAVDGIAVPTIVAFQKEIYRRLGLYGQDQTGERKDSLPEPSASGEEKQKQPTSPTSSLAAWAASWWARK